MPSRNTLIFLLFVLTCSSNLGLADASKCFCNCCIGKECTPQAVGFLSGTTACTCDPEACIEAWPDKCKTPNLGSSVATWSGKHEKCSTPWAGQWHNENSDCFLVSTCCCLSGIMTSSQYGRNVNVSTYVASSGRACDGLRETELYLTLSSPTSTTASLTILGDQRIAITRKGKSLTITNMESPACSSTAKCTEGDCMKSSLAGWEIALIVVGSLFGACLLGGGVYLMIHKQRAHYGAYENIE